jgi:hypothetical protein
MHDGMHNRVDPEHLVMTAGDDSQGSMSVIVLMSIYREVPALARRRLGFRAACRQYDSEGRLLALRKPLDAQR